MSRRTRSRGSRGRSSSQPDEEEDASSSSGLPFITCERAAKVKKNDFEGFKGTDDENDDAEYVDAQVTFSVDHPISLLGVKFASEIYRNPNSNDGGDDTRHPKDSDTYEEEAFIYLLQGGKELADSHVDDAVKYRSMIEAMFSTPYKCEKDLVYKIRVLCNVDGAYPLAKCADKVVKNGVKFNFKVGNPQDSHRDGIIRALLFKKL